MRIVQLKNLKSISGPNQTKMITNLIHTLAAIFWVKSEFQTLNITLFNTHSFTTPVCPKTTCPISLAFYPWCQLPPKAPDPRLPLPQYKSHIILQHHLHSVHFSDLSSTTENLPLIKPSVIHHSLYYQNLSYSFLKFSFPPCSKT